MGHGAGIKISIDDLRSETKIIQLKLTCQFEDEDQEVVSDEVIDTITRAINETVDSMHADCAVCLHNPNYGSHSAGYDTPIRLELKSSLSADNRYEVKQAVTHLFRPCTSYSTRDLELEEGNEVIFRLELTWTSVDPHTYGSGYSRPAPPDLGYEADIATVEVNMFLMRDEDGPAWDDTLMLKLTDPYIKDQDDRIKAMFYRLWSIADREDEEDEEDSPSSSANEERPACDSPEQRLINIGVIALFELAHTRALDYMDTEEALHRLRYVVSEVLKGLPEKMHKVVVRATAEDLMAGNSELAAQPLKLEQCILDELELVKGLS